MAGETVVSFTIGKLRDLLVEEGEYLNALRSPVDELREKLTRMEDLLEYAETRRDKRTSEVIELADKLIDSIESYVVLRVSSKYIGFRERMIRPKVRSEIQEITTKITDLVNGLSETIKVGGHAGSSTMGLGNAYKIQDLSYLNEDDFVGRKDDVENLVHYLIDEEADQHRIISILGMGGLGKTTLARKVYKDKRVVSHFQGFAFICVSQECHAEAILRHILQQLEPEKEEEIKSMSETCVIEQLQIVHRERSCLVVVDDIWSVDDWKSLSRGLPDGDMDSKVIITTRNKDVAEVGFYYTPKCLSEEEGWELLKKKIFLRREYRDSRVDQRMEELGREMIGWCRGIPLALLVLRGVLVTKATLHEWERFYENRTREVEHKQLYGEVIEELLFSYNELPYQVKPCFLYFGYFLEDEEIEVEKLYMLWDAEGMILLKDRKEGETMIDVAERYLGELVGRSMVEAELEEEVNPDTTRRFKSCRLHDLMRELCLSIVRKEKFLKVNDYRNCVLDISCLRDNIRTPRHAFYFSDNSNFSVQIEQEVAQNVRSLRFVKGYPKKQSNMKKIKFVRVLDFNEAPSVNENLTKEIFLHLKYLSFKDCFFDKLPLLVGDFRYLQSLDLRFRCGIEEPLPNALLRNLKRLRHLFLPMCYYMPTPELPRLRLEGMRELETLVNFDSRKCEMKDIIQVANLRRFEGKIHISSKDDAEDWKGLIGYMKKVNLDSSRRSSLIISIDGDIPVNDLNEQLQGFEEIIHQAIIAGLRGKWPQVFDFAPGLSVLSMKDICLEENPIPTLEKLQNLRELTLHNVELKGKEMVCCTMGFPKLRSLGIISMKNLEKWRVEEGAMCNLRSLTIMGCFKLEMLPDGLKFITTLGRLIIYLMPEEFIKRIRVVEGEEGADFYKIRHVPDVYVRGNFFTLPGTPLFERVN